MAAEDVVHIKLEYGEAINGKKAILSAEIGTLRAAKAVNKYKFLRIDEFRTRAKLYSKLKETRSTVKSLQLMFPEPKIPKIIKRVHKEEEMAAASPRNRNTSRDIESQLGEIQRRLNALSR